MNKCLDSDLGFSHLLCHLILVFHSAVIKCVKTLPLKKGTAHAVMGRVLLHIPKWVSNSLGQMLKIVVAHCCCSKPGDLQSSCPPCLTVKSPGPWRQWRRAETELGVTWVVLICHITWNLGQKNGSKSRPPTKSVPRSFCQALGGIFVLHPKTCGYKEWHLKILPSTWSPSTEWHLKVCLGQLNTQGPLEHKMVNR